jgi:hypothetical protein
VEVNVRVRDTIYDGCRMWEHEGERSRVVGKEGRDAGLISDDECKMKCEAALSPLVEIDTRIVQRGGWKHPPQSRRHLINKKTTNASEDGGRRNEVWMAQERSSG